ncbi:MAG TPA: DUF502 domain-containing protein [Planctomycetota bacterium]|nr:DUF502 domain-containing protein [Planctomycetota bacterium]
MAAPTEPSPTTSGSKPRGGTRAARRRPAQRFFLRGLITLLPVVFTVFILITAYKLVTQYVTGPVNSVIYWCLEQNALGWHGLRATGIEPYSDEYLAPASLPLELQDRQRELGSNDARFRAELAAWRASKEGFLRDLDALAIQGERLRRDVTARVPTVIGLVVSLLLVVTLGSLAGGYLGSRLVQRAERAMHVIPVVRSIYPYTKQLVDFFLAERKFDFDTVVAMPYPRRGVWSLGFVTSSGLKSLREHSQRNLVSVFVPSSPMPMTGYMVFIPAEDVVPMPFTVDEALRVIVSGGVLIPPHEKVDIDARAALAEAAAQAEDDGALPDRPESEPKS